jgi:hypothetical membrane protein
MLLIRAAGVCGVAAPVVSFTLLLRAVALSPWFDWHRDALSDLAMREQAALFNVALLGSGCLTLLFALGLRRWLGRGWAATLGCGALFASAIALMALAPVNESYGKIHYWLAVSYYLLAPLGYWPIAWALWRRGERLAAWLTLSASLAALAFAILTPHKGLAVPEMLAALVLGAWSFALGMRLLASPEEPKGLEDL